MKNLTRVKYINLKEEAKGGNPKLSGWGALGGVGIGGTVGAGVGAAEWGIPAAGLGYVISRLWNRRTINDLKEKLALCQDEQCKQDIQHQLDAIYAKVAHTAGTGAMIGGVAGGVTGGLTGAASGGVIGALAPSAVRSFKDPSQPWNKK